MLASRTTVRLLTVVALGGALLVHLLRPSEPWFTGTYLGVLAAAAVVAAVGAFLAPPGRRLVPGLIAAGITASASGDLLWYVAVWTSGEPDISVADIPWFASYLLLAAALWITLLRAQGRNRGTTETVIDALTIMTISVAVLWSVSIDAIVLDTSVSTFIRTVWAAYPVADAILLALVLRVLTDHRARAVIDVWFALGVGCWLVSDLGYLLLTVDGAVELWTDAGWMLGAALMARSTWRRSPVADSADDIERGHALGKLGVATLPLLVPPGLELVAHLQGRPAQPVQMAVAMGALIALTFVRTARLLAAEERTRRDLAVARDAALEGSRAKSAFLATMSHEIRTPMNGVIGLTGLLLTTELDQRQRQYAEGVRGAGEALLAIINDILDFSKVEAGRLELETIDFNLVQVVEEAAELVSTAAQRKELELLAYCSPELPLGLRGDPSRLRQVLLNLAANAVKFTDRGEVVIRAQLEDRTADGLMVRFEVTDTGIGIEPADQERLFDPFSQADSSTTRRFGGTGLGLAICQQLVTAMGGTIGINSAAGSGSTFWFTLPLELAHDPAVTPSRPAGLTGLRVLVVDDNQTNRLILSEQLNAWGMATQVVEDAPTGLAMLRAAARDERPYALVLLDLCMPDMDGLELARLVTADPALTGTPLVLLTSGPDVSQADAVEAGIGARLTKPVHLSQLHTSLQDVWSTRAAAVAPPEIAPPEGAGRGHVLVAEDNSTNQMVAVGILEHLGFTAEVASNGLEALAALERRSFDAVLMDCQMPELDGYDATRELRRREGDGRRTPVIAMTAGVLDDERERCTEAGMDDFVPKPVSPQTLDSTLARWVRTPTI